MDRDKLIQRLRAIFLAELNEHVEVFNRELLSLERGSSDAASAESLKVLFRTAHSLKGAARAVSARKLEMVCHTLEELLHGLRDGKRTLTPDVFEILFGAVDTFEEVGREFAASTSTDPPTTAEPSPGIIPPPPPPFDPKGAAFAPAPMPSTRASDEPGSRPASAPVAARPEIAPPLASPEARLSILQLPASEREPAAANAPDVEALVRVPERKLDVLLAHGGELLIARRRFDDRKSELSDLQIQLSELQTELRKSDRSLRAPSNGHSGGASASLGAGSSAVAGHTRSQPASATPLERVLQRTRERTAKLERDLVAFSSAIQRDLRNLERAAQQLDDQVHHVRMVPFRECCETLYRVVRDLCAKEHKQAELRVEGGDNELDRSIVDGLRAPLMHMVRNAIDHGIETPEERARAGKPARATIVVSAALRGEQVVITVRDDGRGLDLSAIRSNVRKQDNDATESDSDLVRWIFEPGFSTAASVTHVSGRGVGLDVVRSQVEALRGNVNVTSEPGLGTSFALTMPLTVTTLRVLFVRAGGEVLALPGASVLALRRAAQGDVGVVQGRETLLTESAPLPLVSLAEILGLDAALPLTVDARLPVVVLSHQNQRLALAVDELLAEQDVVCKPLGRRIRRLRHASAATLLPNGRIALLLQVGDLVRSVMGRAPARMAAPAFQPSSERSRKRLLLVDDSATIRTLEKSILEAAGHEVMVAVDGSNAWQLLQQHGADLVVSDVEMPTMDGFALTRAIRTSKRFRDLPIILLTSLDTEQDRARGLESGADAYLVKSAFDQSNLLETIRQLL